MQWLMLDVSMPLAMVTLLHELNMIIEDVRPVVYLLKDLVLQGPSFYVTPIDDFMDLA